MYETEVEEGFVILAGEEDQGFQLVGPGGEESGVVPYTGTAEVEVDGKTYSVTVESRESAMTEEQELCLCLDEVPAVEEVEFDLEEGDEDEGEEEDGGGAA